MIEFVKHYLFAYTDYDMIKKVFLYLSICGLYQSSSDMSYPFIRNLVHHWEPK